MKSFHWGYGLIVFFICYISYLVITVIMSTRVDHSLVVDEYYKHDLAYQDMYLNSVANRSVLETDLQVQFDNQRKSLVFDFGSSATDRVGEILLYRPANQGADVLIPFEIGSIEDKYELDTTQLLHGNWTVKVRWTDGTLEYYKEQRINII